MSRNLSFRDIQRTPKAKHLTETELLKIENDPIVNEVLAAMGFDIKQPILYIASKHRDLAGKVAVGFRAVGEIDGFSDYMKSRQVPLIERLIYAAQKDPSLARELSKMIGHSVDLSDDAIDDDEGLFPDEDIDPEYQTILAQIEALHELRDHTRGWPFNEQGNLKTPLEYQAGQ